jgi:hypothetical protein
MVESDSFLHTVDLERSSLLSVKRRKYEILVYYTNTNHIHSYIILLVLRVERDKRLDKEDKESMTWQLSYNSVSCIYIYVQAMPKL